jgi:hypothetical protein
MTPPRLLIPALCLLVLLVTVIPSNASEEKWRAPYSIPGYPPTIGVNLDPRPPRGAEWSWVDRAEGIRAAALMGFTDEWKGRKPIFNYYLANECPDEDTNEVYRNELRTAVNEITRYRDKFVEMYPQFSYLLKLKLQFSEGPLNDNVFNIPVYIPDDCIEKGEGASYGSWFREIGLLDHYAVFHEMVHTLGSGHITYGSDRYYSFRTVWGPTGDIGQNTLSWYALALAWSWLRFYDAHPGLIREDFAQKLQMDLKYKPYIKNFEKWFWIIYIVTAKDALESGITVRPIDAFSKIELRGGAVVPALILKPEEWMKGDPNFDNDWIIRKNKEGTRLLLTRYAEYVKSIGAPWELISFRGLRAEDLRIWYLAPVWDPASRFEDHIFLRHKPPADDEELRFLLFSDLRPDLFFCGYLYRWRGSDEEIFIPMLVTGNETHTPAMLPGKWFGNNIECYYSWGPYIYRAPELYTYPKRIAVGVPASEEVIYDSPSSRRVFKGKWLVNGTEWPGPYLDLDVIGWPVGDRKPWRWPWADGRDPPGCTICPLENRKVYTLRLTGPNGGPIYLDDFTSRYRGFERVPWMRGVTVIYVRYNTTLEPVYEREYLINFTIPEGFKVLDGNVTGWYREGTKIRLPTLSELEVSKGTKLVHEGWKDNSGRIYRPGEELVVDGPKSFEPVIMRYHLVLVKGPKELKHEGSGWYREGSTARLNVVENVTYVSDVTRYVFLGFRRGNETVSEVEVKVDGPVEVEAVWRREHLIIVKSRFLNWTFTNPWFEENATYAIIIPGEPTFFQNGTMIEVKGIETLSGGKRFVAERADLESINITVGGRRVITLWNVTFAVHGPIEMRVLWIVKYALDVRAPAGVVSIRNSSLSLPATVFVEEGEKIILDFKSVQLTGDTRRLVLHDVIMDNRSLGPITSLDIEMKRPVSVIAVYRDQILVWPKLRGQDGSIADPDLVVLISDLGEVVSEEGKAVWLDRYLTLGLRIVEWRVVKAVYKGVDVTVNATVKASEPGTIAIPAGISGLTVRVRDVLGMPVPFANVVYSGPGGEVKASTDYSGVARLGVVPNGQGRVSVGLIGASEGEVLIPPGEHVVVLPVSPYTITLITSLITPTYMVVRRRKNE